MTLSFFRAKPGPALRKHHPLRTEKDLASAEVDRTPAPDRQLSKAIGEPSPRQGGSDALVPDDRAGKRAKAP
ncbi:MAG: hypothetical protein RR784_04190 [Burkholderiaceae bacterium]